MTDLSNASIEELEAAIAAKKGKDAKLAEAHLATALQYTEKHIYKLDYNDLQKWLKATFGVVVELVAVEEWCNGESHEFNSILEGDIDEKDAEIVEGVLFYGASPYHMFSTCSLLEYLVSKEFIPAGDYLIEVFW